MTAFLRHLAYTGLLCLVIAACDTIPVTTDYDTLTDWGRYQSFAWAEPQETDRADSLPPPWDNDLQRRRIRTAIGFDLAARGMTNVDSARADLHIAHFLVTERRYRYDTIHYGYGYRYDCSYWGRYGGYSSTTRIVPYEVDTLVIDLIDARTQTLVWRGSAVCKLRRLRTPEEREERINQTVSAILAHFPPGARE